MFAVRQPVILDRDFCGLTFWGICYIIFNNVFFFGFNARAVLSEPFDIGSLLRSGGQERR